MRSKLLKNDYILSIISKSFNIFFGFLSLIFINRYLGVSLKGEYSSIINYVTILSAIFQFGISAVYSKFKRKKINNCYYVFLSIVFIQFFIYFFVSILSGFILGLKIFIILIISCIAIFTTQLRYINLVENIKYNTIVIITMSISNFIFSLIAFVLLDRNLTVGLLIYALKDLVIILLYLVKIDYKSLFKKDYFVFYKEILREGFLPMLSTFLMMINYKIDIVMLNIYDIDYSLIGLYSLGLSISEYMWIVPDIFKDVVQKRTAKDNSLSTINFSLRCSSTFIVCAYIFLIVFGKFIIKILFGSEYQDSFIVTIILFFGIFSIIYYKIIGQMLISDGKSKQYFLILLVGAIINVVFNVILIPPYNIIGAAFASVFSYSFIGLLFLGFYSKTYKVNIKNTFFINKMDINRISKFIKNKEMKFSD